jgi:hypothetical protein
VSNCGGSALTSFTATLSLGGVEVDSCSPSGGSNCCTLTGTVAGLYLITVTSASVGTSQGRDLECGEDADVVINGRTCQQCLDLSWPATLTMSTPWGPVTLTRQMGFSINEYAGSIDAPGSSYYEIDDCDWFLDPGACPATNKTGDVTVFFRLVCFGPRRMQLTASYLSCRHCSAGGVLTPSGIAVKMTDAVAAAGCNPFACSGFYAHNLAGFAGASDVIDLGTGPNCIHCGAMDGVTLEFGVDLSGMGQGTVALDVSGW